MFGGTVDGFVSGWSHSRSLYLVKVSKSISKNSLFEVRDAAGGLTNQLVMTPVLQMVISLYIGIHRRLQLSLTLLLFAVHFGHLLCVHHI